MGILDTPVTPASLGVVPKWKPTTAYTAGDKVVSPNGDIVSAITSFTSGASYNAANWNVSASYAGKVTSPFLAGTNYSPAKSYDTTRNIYNLNGANWKYARAAMARARAGAGLCRIGVIGDSIAAGWGATNNAAEAWPQKMREALATQGFPAAGTGDVMTGSRGVWGATNADTRFGGGWTLVASANNTGGFGVLTTANGNTYGFTSDKAGTVIEFTYGTQPGWGTFTAVVKNSAGTTLSTTSYDSNQAVAVRRVTLTGLVLDVGSTIVFTATSTNIICVFSCGVRNTTGVLVTNLGVGSSSTSTWNQFAAPGAGFNAGYTAKGVLAAGVDILLIALGVNDAVHASSGVTPAQYATNLAAIVNELKTATTAVALVHPIPGFPGGTQNLWTSPSSSGYSSATFYQQADALGIPMVDMSDRWQDYNTANATGLMSDQVHPSTAGHQRAGLDVAGLLSA